MAIKTVIISIVVFILQNIFGCILILLVYLYFVDDSDESTLNNNS